jgi:probable addiction module antidote protein
MIKTTPYDTADYLDSDEMIAEYLKLTIEDDDPEAFIAALGNVAKARGMERIAKDAGMSRENLRNSLRSGSQARQEAVQKVFKALNIKLTTAAADAAE